VADKTRTIEKLERQLHQLEEERDRLRALNLENVLSLEMARLEVNALERKFIELEAELRAHLGPAPAPPTPPFPGPRGMGNGPSLVTRRFRSLPTTEEILAMSDAVVVHLCASPYATRACP
jgi:hypothetical protein